MRRHLFVRRSRLSTRLTKKRTSLRFLIPLILLLAPFLTLFLIFNSSIFKITQINCSLDGQACRDSHLTFLNQYQGKNLLLTKPNLIAVKLLESDLSLDTADIDLIFPQRLNAILTTNSKIITLAFLNSPATTPPLELNAEPATSSSESSILRPHPLITQFTGINFTNPRYHGLTSSGNLVTPVTDHSQLYFLDDPQSLDKDILVSLFQYEQELEKSAITYDRSLLLNPYYLLYLSDGTYIVFDLNKPSRIAVATLQQIRATDTITDNRAIIDLRFNKPVISNY